MQIALVFFFNNLPQHKISTSLHIELLNDHVLVCFQEIYIPHYHPTNAIVANLWPTCFHKESNLATKSLSLPSMTLQTLHLTCVTFPLTPTIDFSQGNLVVHESWNDNLIPNFFPSFCYWLGLQLLGVDQ
jgi:hypothetical protein